MPYVLQLPVALHLPASSACCSHLTSVHACTVALKGAVHPARPRREVQYVISELVHRLHHASDWLVSRSLICAEVSCWALAAGCACHQMLPAGSSPSSSTWLKRLPCSPAAICGSPGRGTSPKEAGPKNFAWPWQQGCPATLLHRWHFRSAGSCTCTPAGPKPDPSLSGPASL